MMPHETLILPASDPDTLTRAAELLRRGELVAFPTDTVYGVGALYSNPSAVDRIYAAKGRPESKGIPILLASADDLDQVVAKIGPLAKQLAARHWPGPLTLILHKSDSVPAAVSRTATVAVRVPDHPLAQQLIIAAGLPLAVTSANRSGEPATTDPAVVARMLAGRIAAIIDGGLAPGGIASTIVDCSQPDTAHILRPGPIPAEAIAAVQSNLSNSEIC